MEKATETLLKDIKSFTDALNGTRHSLRIVYFR
jgi:hypothetical protein